MLSPMQKADNRKTRLIFSGDEAFLPCHETNFWNIDIYTPIPLEGVSATFRNFGQNDTKRGRNAKSAAETPRAQ